MTDRQTVSTADYEKLKRENEEYKEIGLEISKKIPEFEKAVSSLTRTAYWSLSHKALYIVCLIYVVVDLIKRHA